MYRHLFVLPAFLFLVLLTGCGGKLTPYEGTVTLAGKPLAGVNVTFVADGEKGQSVTGYSDSNGKFTLSTNGKLGVAPGKYKVLFRKDPPSSSSSGGANVQPGTPEYFKMMQEQMAKSKSGPPKSEIPDKYGQVSSSPFSVTIPGGETKFDIVK